MTGPTSHDAPAAAPHACIHVRGARTHNLRDVSLDIPRDALVVITGLSGSGKSSLAFDTLYAEGQRRYVESLSTYARQFLQMMDKPDVDLIEGLSPAISIEQKSTSHNPRSTVGTVTEVHDYLRLLFARVGTPYCPNHPDVALQAQSVSQMADALIADFEEQRVMLLAPVVRDRKGSHADLLSSLQAQGFIRVRVRSTGGGPGGDGDGGRSDGGSESSGESGSSSGESGTGGGSESGGVRMIDEMGPLDAARRHSIDVVVDRVRVGAQSRQRLVESIETALRLSDGRLLVETMPEPQQAPAERAFSSRFACPICNTSLRELEPRLFSFNNPAGACPDCDGLGVKQYFDPKRIVQFPDLSLAAGAIAGWDRRNAFFHRMLQSLAAFYEFDLDTPFSQLPQRVREVVLHGSGDEQIPFLQMGSGKLPVTRLHPFEGVIPNFERRYRESESPQVREELARYLSSHTCPTCGGSRLRAEARHVRVGPPGGDRTIHQLSSLTLSEARDWFDALQLPGARARIGERIVREIGNRLSFLNDVGLEYLSLNRSADTLSGGESQRIRLASQIGSGLTGVMYVLDEPSIGLHQRDNDRLLGTLRRLRDLGNSVLVVEHDEDAIRSADHVIDMGPGAGVHGGQVVAQGSIADVIAEPGSLTGAYLAHRLRIDVPRERHAPGKDVLRVRGARGHSLKNIDVEFPVGLMIAVTGVSGSGKSTLVNDTLNAAVSRHIFRTQAEPAPHDGIDGLEHFDKVISVDQSPIGRTPRSNPATYTGLFTPIRELFAEVPLARERGYGPGRFSFNVKGGRCEACEGDGLLKVEMHFLPDVYVPCDVCGGRRYNRETLEVQYKGSNIAEVLDMTVESAAEFFSAVPVLARKLQTLMDVGLGYIRLGQSATTLSGGEAQRVKLSLELSRRGTGRTLYVLDEPTTGLHFHDIAMLLRVMGALRDAGNTVVVIEHNLDVIKTADWVIDLGPEGGAGGGCVVATGTPEQVAANPRSHTGRYLAKLLDSAPTQVGAAEPLKACAARSAAPTAVSTRRGATTQAALNAVSNSATTVASNGTRKAAPKVAPDVTTGTVTRSASKSGVARKTASGAPTARRATGSDD